MPVLGPHQMMPQQNTMDRDRRQHQPFPLQQGVQLACSPVRRCSRNSSTRCSISAAVRVGLWCGRRLFSSTPAIPPASNLRNHVYPVGREILNSSHNPRRLFSPRLARTTKRILCSSTSTIPHAILPSCKGSFPSPSLSQSVKDVLITTCKGFHETAHIPGCAPFPTLSSRPEQPDFFSRAAVRRVGLRSGATFSHYTLPPLSR